MTRSTRATGALFGHADAARAVLALFSPLAQEVERLRGAEIHALNQGQIFKRERDLALASAREMSVAGRLAGLGEAAEVLNRQLSSGPSYRSGQRALDAILALAGETTGKEG